MSSNEFINNPFEEIKREYARELPGFWKELRDSITSTRKLIDRESLSAAATLAHRLNGNAGSYGFSHLGNIAGKIEKLLCAMVGVNPHTCHDMWSEIMEDLIEGDSYINSVTDTNRSNLISQINPTAAQNLVISDEHHLNLIEGRASA